MTQKDNSKNAGNGQAKSGQGSKPQQPEKNITPHMRPGAYRMVTNLKETMTGYPDIHQWPAVYCDDDMSSFLLLGKKKPKDGREAYEYPGIFHGAPPPTRATAIPMYLVDKRMAIYVPSNMLSTVQISGLATIARDKHVPKEYSEACRHAVLCAHHDAKKGIPYSLTTWKDEMRKLRTSTEEQAAHAPSAPRRVVESVEVMDNKVKATSSPPELSIKPEQQDEEPEDQGDDTIRNKRGRSETALDEKVDDKGGSATEIKSAAKQVSLPIRSSKADRQASRKAQASRKCKAHEVRVMVSGGESFIVPSNGLAHSGSLIGKVEHNEDDQEDQVYSSILAKLDGDDFEPVAQFMTKGDFDPEVLDNGNGTYSLAHFDLKNPDARRELTILCLNVCKVAFTLKIGLLRHRAVAKLRTLAGVSKDAFVRSIQMLLDIDFCNDEGLRMWAVDRTAAIFHQVLDEDPKFHHVLRDSPAFATMVYRKLAGLPAVEEKPKRRKPRIKREHDANGEPAAATDANTPAPGPAKKKTKTLHAAQTKIEEGTEEDAEAG